MGGGGRSWPHGKSASLTRLDNMSELDFADSSTSVLRAEVPSAASADNSPKRSGATGKETKP